MEERKDSEFGHAYSPDKADRYQRRYGGEDTRRRVTQTDLQPQPREYVYEGGRDSYS